jgi:ferredoxin
MPKVILHKNGEKHEGEIKDNGNLVVSAGIKKFPFPHLSYGCGMGKCAKCACIIIDGGDDLPAPNWKEKKQLGAHLEQGYRLACQLWLTKDVELTQDGIDPVLQEQAQAK